MFRALFLISNLVGTSLWASTLEVHYLRSLSRARSHTEVEFLQQSYSQVKTAQTACAIQLKERLLPSACYEVVNLESQLKLNGSTKERSAKIRHLDRLCAIAAENLHLQTETLALSPKCLQIVQAAHAIQDYRDEEAADWSKF